MKSHKSSVMVTSLGTQGRYVIEHENGEMPVSHQTENRNQPEQQQQ